MKTLIVAGGGAAGFFCAVNAARLSPELKVIILEKSDKLLSKVKISGGGRCNVTHDCDSISEMATCYPRGEKFLKKAFHHFFVKDTIQWFEERGVLLKVEPDGRMFPVTDSSQTIVDCLLNEAASHNVEIIMHTGIKDIHRENERWYLDAGTRILTADYVCIASGGFPKLEQFNWLKKTEHQVSAPVPSLFTFNMPGNSITELMGVAVPALVKINGTKYIEKGALLITHWGMSGPAILKLSAWAARDLQDKNYHFNISINWLPSTNENILLAQFRQYRFQLATQKLINRNPFGLPQRLWEYLMDRSDISADIRWADLPAKNQNLLVKNVCAQQFEVKGKTTYKDEFVTSGGIELNDIDVNSMESRKFPGLFFAGEVLNIDGITGGYNFQNAWTTGFIAANAIAKKVSVSV